MNELDLESESAEIEESLRPTIGRRLGFIGVGGVFLLLGIYGVVTGLPLINLFDLLFLLVGGKLTHLGVDSLPLLEWDEEGLIDRTSLVGEALFIPWSDIDSVSTGQIHSGVRLNLKRKPRCFTGLGPGRLLQRFVSWIRGFRGIEISPSFMRVDYRRLGHVLDELVIEAQMRELRESRPAGELPEGGPLRELPGSRPPGELPDRTETDADPGV
ncbi:MAG: hypothetical protein RQ745_13295 [Longimicrobiales bacterium]|nr:hypothetical protein [Longimicrobiales bacterium]